MLQEFCVEARELHFNYQNKKNALGEALSGLSFKAKKGHITGILGPNGSGKSTTFKILSTEIVPSRGEATVAGFSVTHEKAKVRKSLGVCFQSPSLDPILTINENLLLHAKLYGLSFSEAKKRSAKLLEIFSLGERSADRVDTLSGGLKRRVELIKALLSEPQVLLLDEPTTGLDPKARYEFWKELRRLQNSGISVLVTTHLIEEADGCDELLFLKKGKLAASGTPAGLKDKFGRDILIFESTQPEALFERFKTILSIDDNLSLQGEKIKIESKNGAQLFDAFRNEAKDSIKNMSWGKASLADVYLAETGEALQ